MEGWISLHRKLLESEIFQNEKLLKLWIWCLLKATHKEHEQLIGMQRVTLKKGQFIFGRKKASEELKMSENMVYRYMNFLESEGNIDIKTNNKYTVVTIEKWEEYQNKENEIDSKMNNKQTTNRQQIDTNNNVNNIYLYFINKYKSNERNFVKQNRIIRQMKEDELWEQLTWGEQLKLQTAIFNEVI